MGHFSQRFNHAQFHEKYLKNALKERRMSYSKSSPGSVAQPQYLQGLIKRSQETNHIASFEKFMNLMHQIQSRLE